MSAELVDPFATPKRPVWSALAVDEMDEGVRYYIVWTRREDPAELARDLLRKTLHEVRQRASTDPWAAALLEQLWHRAESGVRYTWDEEPREPDWSLDSSKRDPLIEQEAGS